MDYFTDFTNKGEVKTVAGGNGEGSSADQLSSPNGIAFDDSGNLLMWITLLILQIKGRLKQ